MLQIQCETSYKNALEVLNSVPEFSTVFSGEMLNERLSDERFILIALENEIPVGCKIAYKRFYDGSLYSWLGGVIPEYRNHAIAQQLSAEMEKLAKKNGYNSIVFKTRNKFKGMLRLALKSGYNIIGFEEKIPISENRIILKKQLL